MVERKPARVLCELGWCVFALALATCLVRAQDPAPAVTLTEIACIADRSVGYATHPSLAGDGKGTAWLCWLSHASGGADQVMFKTFQKGEWGKPSPVAMAGQYDTPVVASAVNGTPMVAWVAVNDGKWEIFASRWDGDRFSSPQLVVSSEQGRCRNPALAAGNNGVFVLAWEAYRNGVFQVYAKGFDGQKWGAPVEIGEGGLNGYNPAVALLGDTPWVAYSKAYKAKSGMRDLVVCELDPKSLAVRNRRVAASGSRMSYPSLATDSLGRLWISGVDLDSGNSFFASSFAVCRDQGTFSLPAGKHEAPAAAQGSLAKGATAAQGLLPKGSPAANMTLPLLVEDGARHLVALAREAILDTKHLDGRRAWGITAWVLTDKGWSEACRLVSTAEAGRKDVFGAVPLGDGRVLLAWQQDTIYSPSREKQNVQIPVPHERSGSWTSTLYSGILRVAAQVPTVDAIAMEKIDVSVVTPPTGDLVQRPARSTVTRAGTEYTVLWGNIHEHSDFSVCNARGADGNLDDNYRHHLDAAPYDFCSMTDHTKNLNEFMWRESIRASEFYNDPPHFIVFPGNENSAPMLSAEDFNANLKESGTEEAVKKYSLVTPLGGYGHYNIFFASAKDAERFLCTEASGGPTILSNLVDGCRTITEMCARLRALHADALVIPHQLADPEAYVDWDAFQPDFMPVAEIFQSRGSYEYQGAPATKEEKNAKFKKKEAKKGKENKAGHYAQDAFAKGLKFGFIASGDHSNTGLASTAVLVKEKTPAGIFEALRAARCYATSTPGQEILVEVLVNGHLMGERVRDPSGDVKIVADVKTRAPIASVALFRNGEDLLADKKLGVGATTAKVDLVDKLAADEAYYYLRVVTEKGIAWTSPVWFSRK